MKGGRPALVGGFLGIAVIGVQFLFDCRVVTRSGVIDSLKFHWVPELTLTPNLTSNAGSTA
ncbi:hypothetical protein ACLK15_11205 [Escherichia coli]